MACPIIIRAHDGSQSYLVLHDNPRELLHHPGFPEEYSVRPWLGSLDPFAGGGVLTAAPLLRQGASQAPLFPLSACTRAVRESPLELILR